jgi:Na+-driven multidrug efflux pump
MSAISTEFPENNTYDNPNTDPEKPNKALHYWESQEIYRKLVTSMLPCCATLLLSFSSNSVSLYFIGLLNQPLLVSALGLAYLWLNGWGFGLIISVADVMAIYIGAALGSKSPKKIVTIFTNGVLCIFIASFAIVIIATKSEYLFIKFGFNKAMIAEACFAMKCILPSIIAMSVSEAFKA